MDRESLTLETLSLVCTLEVPSMLRTNKNGMSLKNYHLLLSATSVVDIAAGLFGTRHSRLLQNLWLQNR